MLVDGLDSVDESKMVMIMSMSINSTAVLSSLYRHLFASLVLALFIVYSSSQMKMLANGDCLRQMLRQ